MEKRQSNHPRKTESVLPYLQNKQLQARASWGRGPMNYKQASWLILTTRLYPPAGEQHYACSGISPVGAGDAGSPINGNDIITK
jgi:hypothetical protein